MAINKVEYGGNVLMDLTADTVNASGMLSGLTAHNAAGNLITGTAEKATASVTGEKLVLTDGFPISASEISPIIFGSNPTHIFSAKKTFTNADAGYDFTAYTGTASSTVRASKSTVGDGRFTTPESPTYAYGDKDIIIV